MIRTMMKHRVTSFLLFFAVIQLLTVGCGQGGSGSEAAVPGVQSTDDFGPPREVVLYLEDNFDGQKFSPKWGNAGFKEELYSRDGVAKFAQFEGHGDVVHYYIPAGDNEFTPVQLSVEGSDEFTRLTGKPEIDEFYLEWSEFFPEDHDFADSGQKLIRFTYWKEGEERGLELNWAVLNNNDRMQLVLYHPKGLEDDGLLDTGLNTVSMPVGRWVRFGVWAKMNTPSKSDGFVVVYMDGTPIVSQTRMSLRGSDSRGWNIMWLGGNHSNWELTTRASSRYFDDVKFYSTKPRE